MSKDYPGAFEALRRVLEKHTKGMIVEADTPTSFTVITRATGPNKKPLWFGAVTSRKSAVSYHLMPLYYNPKLLATITPELKARMQGKACFNFQRPDADLFSRLDDLTRRGREQWERGGLLVAGPISPERMMAFAKSVGVDTDALAKQRKAKAALAARRRAATLAGKRLVARKVAAAGGSARARRTTRVTPKSRSVARRSS